MKKRGLFLISFVILSIFLTISIYAQEEVDASTDANVTDGEDTPIEVPENTPASSVGYVSPEGEVVSASTESAIEEKKFEELVKEAEEFDEELEINAGLTPDSPIYFIDEIFDNFASEEKLRQERIAEMRELALRCGQGDERACGYIRESFEKYKKHADKFGEEVSPEQKEEALRSSQAIRGVAIREIAQNLPPEQKDEFVREIIFAEKDIATAAEIAGKIKELCEALSKIDPLEYSRVCKTNDDAPEWQKKLDKELTDGQRQEAKLFGSIMSECFRTAGQQCRCEEIPFTEFAKTCSMAAPLATACEIEGNENACEQLDNLEMPELPEHLQDVFDSLEGDVSEAQFDLHMPRECREANARNPKECMKIMIEVNAPEECRGALIEANVQNEREARKICEEIMFKLNAPEECVEQGIRNPKECGKLMFQLNAPQECLDAGLTGESRGDDKKCREIMESSRGPGNQGFGGFGGNCRAIENSEERLRCYDSATEGTRSFDERSQRNYDAERQCAERCLSQGGAWDFSNGNCQCTFPEHREFGGEFQPPEGFIPPEEFNEPIPQGEIQPSENTETTPESTTTEPAPSETTTTPTDAGTTGAVVNDFYRYYYG